MTERTGQDQNSWQASCCPGCSVSVSNANADLGTMLHCVSRTYIISDAAAQCNFPGMAQGGSSLGTTSPMSRRRAP